MHCHWYCLLPQNLQPSSGSGASIHYKQQVGINIDEILSDIFIQSLQTKPTLAGFKSLNTNDANGNTQTHQQYRGFTICCWGYFLSIISTIDIISYRLDIIMWCRLKQKRNNHLFLLTGTGIWYPVSGCFPFFSLLCSSVLNHRASPASFIPSTPPLYEGVPEHKDPEKYQPDIWMGANKGYDQDYVLLLTTNPA